MNVQQLSNNIYQPDTYAQQSAMLNESESLQQVNSNTLIIQQSFNFQQSVQSSRQAFWHQVYQFPFGKPNFSTSQQSKDEKSNHSTAYDAWNTFNPQKRQNFSFDIYQIVNNKSSKSFPPEENANLLTQSIQIEQRQKNQYSHIENQSKIIMKNTFNINYSQHQSFNVPMPFERDYKPFSCFQSQQYQKQQENPYYQNEKAIQMNLSKISQIKQIADKKKYFFQISSIQSQQMDQQIKIQDLLIKQSKISKINQSQEINSSFLWNYKALLEPMNSFKRRDLGWDLQNQNLNQSVIESRIFQVYRENNLTQIHKMQQAINLSQEMRQTLSDEYVITQISKMLQNIECQLFTLDYMNMRWSLDLTKFRLQHSFRSSLKYQIQQILLLASYRSRIDSALQYIRKRSYRKIYYELGAKIQQILIFFEQTVLQQATKSHIIEYFLKISKLKPQIRLIYKLIINQTAIEEEERSYENFDYRYLNSQYVIFKEITKMAKFNDSLSLQISPIINLLLNSAFKPIITILNRILFEQITILELNDELYLKYYFDNHKDIINCISKKVNLIKSQNNDIYLICKMKEDLEIVQDMHALKQYENKWQRNFNLKHKYIKDIIKKYKLKVSVQRSKKQNERMKEIYELKSKFYKEKEEQNSKIRQISQRNKEQLLRLKKQMDFKEQRRKLLQKIEKEKQKGLLLDLQLRQKLKRKKQKQDLSNQISKLQSQSNIVSIENTQKLNNQSDFVDSELQVIQNQKEEPFKETLKNQSSVSEMPNNFQKKVLKSQQIIQSSKLIQPKSLIITADNFFIKKEDNRQKNYTIKQKQSYLKIDNASFQSKESYFQGRMDMEIQSNSSLSSQQQDPRQQFDIKINREVNISTSLQICVNDIIKKQIEVIQSSLRFIVIQKYQVIKIFTFMKDTFMSGNAEKIHQLLTIAVDHHSKLNLKYFSQCLLFDTHLEIIQKLQPSFYYCKNNKFNMQIDILGQNIENFIGFQFKKVPPVLEPYFSYFHLSKYMQIFNFMLKIKHCERLISNSWKLLNNYNRQIQKRMLEGQNLYFEQILLKKMFNVRYTINHFLLIFQNYMFMKIIQKQFKKMVDNVDNLDQMQANHHAMLDNIIKYSFIDNQNHNISQNFRKMLNQILKFCNTVVQMTIGDLPKFKYDQVSAQIKEISKKFDKELKNVQSLIYKLN